jgi:hypothetical protein
VNDERRDDLAGARAGAAFSYESIEVQIVEALPELRPTAERYWADEGAPGDDSGAYIFVSEVVEDYVDVLLSMPDSAARDRLLGRAFGVVEEMLDRGDRMVRELACVQLLEFMEPWWYARAVPFMGPKTQAECAMYPGWHKARGLRAPADPNRMIIDLYGARDVIAVALGVHIADVPGVGAPRKWERLSPDEARHAPHGVAFLGCFATAVPYVICPASSVSCSVEVLEKLALDLARVDGQPPAQASTATAGFYRIARGERVWNLSDWPWSKRPDERKRHGRWAGETWIAKPFGRLATEIRDVLAGRRDGLSGSS